MQTNILILLVISFGFVNCNNTWTRKDGGYNSNNKPNATRSGTTTTTNTPSPEPLPGRHRIIGGIETKRNEYPFIVSLADNQHFCGGSIIDREWIITAAHCTGNGIGRFDITAGEHDLRIPEGTEQVVKAVKIIRHPYYNPVTYEDDIALVKVSPPFNFTQHVQSFNMPHSRFVATGDVLTAGWGVTAEGSQDVSPVLRKVTIGIIPNMDCSKQYGKDFHAHKMICAGVEGGGKDACQGDSGGPLLCNDYHDGAFLCGIVSFGFGCARPEFSGVYTKVAYYADWIEWEKAKDGNPGTKYVWTTHNPVHVINSTTSYNITTPPPWNGNQTVVTVYRPRSTRRPRRNSSISISSNFIFTLFVLATLACKNA